MIQIILALMIGYLFGHARGYDKAKNIYQRIYWKEIDDLRDRLNRK